MNSIRSPLAWIGLILGPMAAATAWAAPKAENLVPMQHMERQDSNGFGWNVSQNGNLANDSRGCFNYAMHITVGGQFGMQQMSFQQQLMTADGSVFVFSGAQVPGLEVSRRIRLDLKQGIAQYIDSFRNATAAPVTATVNVAVQLSSQATAIVTSTGSPLSGALGEKDVGILMARQLNVPSALFYLTNPKSKVRPNITNQNNFTFSISYPLTVPAGKTASLVYGVAQRNITGTPDSKALAGLFKPFKEASWARAIPSDLRHTIVNLGSSGQSDVNYGGELPDVLADLGDDRGPHDVLRVGEQTRLRGTLTVKELTISTRNGPRRLPLERIAAIIGGNQRGRNKRLLLRDGQVFVGNIIPSVLKFALNSGLEATCKLADLDRLVLHEQPGDGQPGPGVFAYFELPEGDRLALASGPPQKLVALTAWGQRTVPLADIHHWSVPNSSQETVGHRIVLNDGSAFTAFVQDETLKLRTTDHGSQEVSVLEIQRFRTAAASAKDADRAALLVPHAILAGDNLFVGQIELPVVHLISQGQVIPLAPPQIKLLLRDDTDSPALGGDEPIFQATLWDGDVAVGTLREKALPLRAGGDLLQVPVSDLLELRVPTPTVPESLRKRIAELINDLGDPQWPRRDAATKELIDFGAVGMGQYQEALEQASDLEVRKRLQALIDAVKE